MPSKLSPAISNNDSIFPWYIVRELPIGVSGLLVAGIFSAHLFAQKSPFFFDLKYKFIF
tara:strand:+ start:3037 stop:3213 length:177 start_codon:yes stop_codon:yes gene_type:complete